MTWGSRRRLAGAWAMVPFALLLLSTQIWPEPPERLPTHWSGARPDGFSDGGVVLYAALVIAGLSSVLAALVAAIRVLVPGLWSRWIVAVLATVSGGAAAGYGVGAWATSLGSGPDEVHLAWVLVAVVAALLSGFVALLVHGRQVPSREDLLDDIPERSRVAPLAHDAPGADRQQEWAATSASRLLVGISIYTAAVFAVCAAVVLWGGAAYRPLLVAVVLIGIPLTLFVVAWTRIVVVVDGRGLRVRSDRLPVTLVTVTPDQVLGVEVIELDPMRWGGYGLRGSARGTAYVVQGGDALLVHRTNGRRLALECTEGEPREGAATLLRVAGQALALSRSGSAAG